MDQQHEFIFVLEVQHHDHNGAPSYVERKTYWPKKDGSVPKALIDQMEFWAPRPWLVGTRYDPAVRPDMVSTTKVYRFRLETSEEFPDGVEVQVDVPVPQPIDITPVVNLLQGQTP